VLLKFLLECTLNWLFLCTNEPQSTNEIKSQIGPKILKF